MLKLLSYAALLTQFIVGTFLVAPTFEKLQLSCTQNDFVCDEDNLCIPIQKRCDGHNDCLDLTDEMDCDMYRCEEPHWFKCTNKKCISKSFVCDNENDCGDFSDEQRCLTGQVPLIKASQNCAKDEWQCSDRLCIPREWECNGEVDCLDGSDEHTGCEKHTCDGFKCKNNQCIPKEWRCDKTSDCKDGSDEVGCGDYTPEDCSFEKGFFQCATEKNCIKTSELCDGIAHCHDKSDESSALCDCHLNNCTHGCIKTSKGIHCLCPHGYHAVDSFNCVDINECEIYGICDQKCRNTQGAYECYCARKYALQSDKMTCKVNDGEAQMIFSTKNEIRGYFLQSQLYFPIAKKLKQAIGVAFDGTHVYWTEILSESEGIVRSFEDGTHRQVLVRSGLGTPEDLSIDWITGNIYFTDSELQHIGVCTNDGTFCTILINHAIDKPRAIVLNPLNGVMYWSDWGRRPEIAKANMDGTEDISFVSNEIYWPNGLALDLPNQRLYWTDAKSLTIESIKLDGSARRIIIQGIVKHPYALAVFEDRIFWSDWITHSIESCNKFTGRDHHILIKQAHDYIYDLHIYHSAVQLRRKNPCTLAFCSDLCLLSGNSYTCACPENKFLDEDKHTCKLVVKNQQLIVGTRDTLLLMQYQQLGKHNSTKIRSSTFQNISALAYNSVNHTVFISDSSSKSLIVLNIYSGHTDPLLNDNEAEIVAMDYDVLGNNLYWCDSKKAVIEVLNLNTMSRKVLLSDMVGETPTSIAVVPAEDIMLVAFQTSTRSAHIDRFRMDGSHRTHVAEQGLLGPIHLLYDSELRRIYWADSGNGMIETTSVDGADKQEFRTLPASPIGIASVNKNIFWINRNSKNLYWAAKKNSDTNNKRVTIDIPGNSEIVHLISIIPQRISTHPCQRNNGDCSHICLASVGALCACPLGMKLENDNKTCSKPIYCELNEFFCQQSQLCISKDMRCDRKKDCIFGEDEKDCVKLGQCPSGHFKCQNNQCIKENLRCDNYFDCKDKSDEDGCNINDNNTSQNSTDECSNNESSCDKRNSTCNSNQFTCKSGGCIPKHWECDQEYDCNDLSDEHKNCGYAVCKSPKFQCNNGLCIDSVLKCNKINDCGDFSDELSCPTSNRQNKCKANEFHCYKNDSLCFPVSSRCNGTSECPQHEDEQGCSDCHMDEFECNNKKCISRQWICDHINDCGDNSDENIYLCVQEHNVVPQNASCENRFRCKNGQCIDMSEVCDNNDDCGDRSDEDGACSMACDINNNPCSHICMRTPTGPQCYCNTGFKVRGDGRTCTDIKECSIEPPVCSQICNEESGSFSCSCYDGYKLRADERSCKSLDEGMSIIFSASNELYRLFYTTNMLKVLYSDPVPKITGIEVSVKKNLVYFSTESGQLYRIRLLQQKQEYINDVGQPRNLAVDWIAENIYFVNNDVERKSIRLCNFETQFCTDLLHIDRHSKVTGLAVDAVNGQIFYTLSSWQIFTSPNSVIYKCDLDGSNLQQLTNSLEYITGVTYNINRKILYYGDYHSGKIYKIHYDGTNQAEIISNLTKPVSLSVFEEHLYFYTDDGRMTVCPLFKNYQACKSYRVYGRFSELFVIYHTSRQPLKTNACENHNCTYMCVPKNNVAKCLCSSEVINSNPSQCHNKQVITASYKSINNHESVDHKKTSEQGSFNTAIAVMISLLITLICVAIYYYLRKKRSGNFSINVRFQNPVYRFLQEPNQQDVIIHPGQHEYYNPINSVGASEMQDTKKIVL